MTPLPVQLLVTCLALYLGTKPNVLAQNTTTISSTSTSTGSTVTGSSTTISSTSPNTGSTVTGSSTTISSTSPNTGSTVNGSSPSSTTESSTQTTGTTQTTASLTTTSPRGYTPGGNCLPPTSIPPFLSCVEINCVSGTRCVTPGLQNTYCCLHINSSGGQQTCCLNFLNNPGNVQNFQFPWMQQGGPPFG